MKWSNEQTFDSFANKHLVPIRNCMHCIQCFVFFFCPLWSAVAPPPPYQISPSILLYYYRRLSIIECWCEKVKWWNEDFKNKSNLEKMYFKYLLQLIKSYKNECTKFFTNKSVLSDNLRNRIIFWKLTFLLIQYMKYIQ